MAINLVYFPYEVLFEIAFNLEYGDVVEFCGAHPRLKCIFEDEVFWGRKAKREFGITFEKFLIPDYTKLIASERYLQLAAREKKIYKGSERHMSSNLLMYWAAKRGNVKLLEYYISKRIGAVNYIEIMNGISRNGDLELMKKYMPLIFPKVDNICNYGKSNQKEYITTGALNNMSTWMKNTAFNGNMEMIEYLFNIFIVPNEKYYNICNSGMVGAVEGNQSDIIIYFLTIVPADHRDDIVNCGLFEAAETGNLKLVKFFESFGDHYMLEWGHPYGLSAGCRNREVTNYIRDKIIKDGIREPPVINHNLEGAVKVGDLDLAKEIIEHYSLTFVPYDSDDDENDEDSLFPKREIDNVLRYAIKNKDNKMIEYIESVGIRKIIEINNIDSYIIGAIMGRDPFLLKDYLKMVDHGNFEIDFSMIVREAKYRGDLDIIRILFDTKHGREWKLRNAASGADDDTILSIIND